MVRLRRIGLRCGWPGPGATLLPSLASERREPENERRLANEQLLFETQASDRVEAVAGLRELAAELADDQVSANRVGLVELVERAGEAVAPLRQRGERRR